GGDAGGRILREHARRLEERAPVDARVRDAVLHERHDRGGGRPLRALEDQDLPLEVALARHAIERRGEPSGSVAGVGPAELPGREGRLPAIERRLREARELARWQAGGERV